MGECEGCRSESEDQRLMRRGGGRVDMLLLLLSALLKRYPPRGRS